MTAAIHTPLTGKQASKIGPRLWRKQVLPVGSIDYQGKRLDFTRDYLATLVDSFNAQAYDTVKLQFADAQNTHTDDPERARGTVKALELTGDGLDMLVDLTDDGAKVIADHPDLPVSARIVEGLQRADGKSFPRAIKHVLATLDPRVTGMRPWQAVDLANEDIPLLDLSTETLTTHGGAMPEVADALTPEETAKLRELLNGDGAGKHRATTEPDDKPDDADDLTDEELRALVEDAENSDAPVGAELTAEARQAIDLANATAAEASAKVAVLQAEAAKAAWKAESMERAGKGTPKALLDLAAPWCGGNRPDGFIDLANTETTVEQVREQAAATVRKMLDEFKGLIDLSVIGETPEDGTEAQARAEAVKNHRQRAGI